MVKLSEFLTRDHNACDNRFAAFEQAVQDSNWPQADEQFDAFSDATLMHFQAEEEILFPALESVMGHSSGPTQVMRMEHTEMRQLFDDMKQALATRDADALSGIGDTLVIMLQQHNAKEEQVLYPLADQLLGSDAESLLERLQAAV